MIIYLFGKIKNGEALPAESLDILESLKEMGATVITNLEDQSQYNLAQEIIKEADKSGEPLIKKVDAIILETSNQEPEISYLIAQAALHKKPTLCLYQRKAKRHNTLDHLSLQPQLEFLKTSAYTPKTLTPVLLKFLKDANQLKYCEDIPSKKFTLRISPRIEKYLNWKAKNSKATKATYLRKKISKSLKKDKKYQEYLETHV